MRNTQINIDNKILMNYNKKGEILMSNELFFIIYFSPLLCFIIIGIISVFIGNKHFLKKIFSIDEIKNMCKTFKEKSIKCLIIMIILLITLIPLNILKPKYYLIMQFIILFININFLLSFIAYLQRYKYMKKNIEINKKFI